MPPRNGYTQKPRNAKKTLARLGKYLLKSAPMLVLALALSIAAGNDDLGFIEIVADSGALAFLTSRGEEAVFHAHAHVRPEGGIGKGGDVTGHGIGHKIFHRAGLVFGRFRGVSQQAAAIEGQTGRQHEKGRETFHEFSWKGKAGIGPLLVSPGQAETRDPASGVKRAGEAPDR